MLFLTDLASLVLLGIIVFQDFGQRQISWILLPLLFTGFALKAALLMQMADLLSSVLFNLGFIAVQLLLLTVWISIKNKKWTSIIDVHLGLGDVLFFVAISTAFSPFQYVFFYVISIVITLTGFVLYKWVSKNTNPEIPLAGAMSAVLMVLMIVSALLPQLNFHNDPLFISFI